MGKIEHLNNGAFLVHLNRKELTMIKKSGQSKAAADKLVNSGMPLPSLIGWDLRQWAGRATRLHHCLYVV